MVKNQTVLITGGSKGIGFALAKIFYANNYNLVLVSKSEANLKNARNNLLASSQIKSKPTIYTIPIDLSKQNSAYKLYQQIHIQHLKIDILINNFGLGGSGKLYQTNLDEELDIINANITTPTILTRLFIKDMVSQKFGKILNVASTAAFQPGPGMSVFYASKAYLLSFSEALCEEYKKTPIQISVLCPGPTKTSYYYDNTNKSISFNFNWMDPDKVAAFAFNKLFDTKPIIIPGILNQIQYHAVNFIPRKLLLPIFRSLIHKRNS